MSSIALSQQSLASTPASGVPSSNGGPHDVYSATFGEQVPAASIGSMPDTEDHTSTKDPYWCLEEDVKKAIRDGKQAGKPVRWVVMNDPKYRNGKEVTENAWWDNQREICKEEEAAQRAFDAEQQNAGRSETSKPGEQRKVATISSPSFTQRSTYSDVFGNPPDEVQINFDDQISTLADVPTTDDVPCTDEDFPEYQPKPIQGLSTPEGIRKIYVNGQEFDLPPDSTLTPPQITQAVIDALGLTRKSGCHHQARK
ncbi:hypothetical protein HD553DRAFT_356815 [Filobasidium floriforme]|uniref:uncharacterized protein n=1 Tax=Filobasidium floriforme TaxID=5210 RepID=UPI001E8D714D|nr:uncharacterized protein HD553DRAFT_356815 [Filobasidium floriforme]KAH8083558.1 hypothetical protein HD553DRAFT_356815 [Filobasidium floriforme]